MMYRRGLLQAACWTFDTPTGARKTAAMARLCRCQHQHVLD